MLCENICFLISDEDEGEKRIHSGVCRVVCVRIYVFFISDEDEDEKRGFNQVCVVRREH